MANSSSNNAYKFPKNVLKNELEQAKNAGVDLNATIKASLAENLDTENAPISALIQQMETEAQGLRHEVDQIVDEVFVVLQKDVTKFKALIQTLRKARRDAEFESAKITVDQPVLAQIQIEPIELSSLIVTPPEEVTESLRNDTDDLQKKVKNTTAIQNDVHKLAPPSNETDFAGLRKALGEFTSRDKINLTTLGYKLEDIINLNNQEYNKKTSPKTLYYITSYEYLEKISYDDTNGWSNISSDKLRDSSNKGLSEVREVLRAELVLQEITKVISAIEGARNGGSFKEGSIPNDLERIYKVVQNEKIASLQALFLEKLQTATELLNRYSTQALRYYDNTAKLRQDYANNPEDKWNKARNQYAYPETLRNFLEQRYLEYLLQENDKITGKLNALETIEDANQKNKAIEQTTKDALNTLKLLRVLIKQKGALEEKATQLESLLSVQLEKLLSLWNRQGDGYFHYVHTDERNYNATSLKQEYIGNNVLGRHIREIARLSNKDTALYYEKASLQKVLEYIDTMALALEEAKQDTTLNMRGAYAKIALSTGEAYEKLRSIQPESTLKPLADELIRELDAKIATILDLINESDDSRHVFTYENGNWKEKEYAPSVGEKLGKTKADSTLYQKLLQKYNTTTAEKYINFQNELATAFEGEDNDGKVARLLLITKNTWEDALKEMHALKAKSQDPAIEEAITTLQQEKQEVADTIVKILITMNNEMAPYGEDTVIAMPENIDIQLRTIKQYKESTEKQYPEAMTGLLPLSETERKIGNQKNQLDSLERNTSQSNHNKIAFDELLATPSLSADEEVSVYIENSLVLKQRLRDAQRAASALEDKTTQLTNTHAKTGMKLLHGVWDKYVQDLTERVNSVNKILLDKHIKEEEPQQPLFPKDIIKLQEIFTAYKALSPSIEEQLATQERGLLESERENTEEIKEAYEQLEAACRLTETDIDVLLTIDENTTIETFSDNIRALIAARMNKEYIDKARIEGHIKSFTDWHTKRINLESAIRDHRTPSKEQIINTFVSDEANTQGMSKKQVAAWIEKTNKEEAIEQKKEANYPLFIKKFVVDGLSSDSKDIFTYKLQERQTAKVDMKEKAQEELRNKMIGKINALSLQDYTPSMFAEDHHTVLFTRMERLWQQIQKDGSIEAKKKDSLRSEIEKHDTAFSEIHADKSMKISGPLTFKNTSELLPLYEDDIPESRKAELAQVFAMLDRWLAAGFNQKLLYEKLDYINQTKPLVMEVSFKDLLKIDTKSELELQRWKQIIISRILEKLSLSFNNGKDRPAVEKQLGDYLDIVISLPSNVLGDRANIMNGLETQKKNLPDYAVVEFTKAIKTNPEDSLETTAQGEWSNTDLADAKSAYETHETNKTNLSNDKIKFFLALSQNQESSIILAMQLLKETFPHDQNVQKNYDELTTFGKLTVISKRRDKIIALLNPEKIFDDAIKAEDNNMKNKQTTIRNLLSTSKSKIRDHLDTLGNIIRAITNSLNQHHNAKLPMNFTQEYVEPVRSAETYDIWKQKVAALLKRYRELTAQIQTDYIVPIMNSDRYKQIQNIDITIEKLKAGTLNTLTVVQP